MLGMVGRKIRKAYRGRQTPHGKQSVRKLMAHGTSTNSIELSGDAKSFDRVARKWNVDYAFYKTGPDKYLLFFKAGQADAMTACFSEYSRKVLSKAKSNRVPIREQLQQAADQLSKEKPKQKERAKEVAHEDRYTVSFIGETHSYTLLLAKNTDKESQVVEALHKALPALTIVIVAISVLAAVFYAWYMTAPIKKISKMSKQMANMDFGSLCPVERTDEIGVLSDSLNTLSSNLSAALTELKDANQKLQADIDKEKELELRRMEFFSAASHELKTPITIIKGQLQGMLCGVGRYKDRETYLAQSLEVTNSLEKMVQELLTVSRIEAPQ